MITAEGSLQETESTVTGFPSRPSELIGQSSGFESIREVAQSVAGRKSTVLVFGETGTGKEMLAKFIHGNSGREDKPFVPVDCSAITGSLFENELFGHVKGAFTGAVGDSLGFIGSADRGTLFLDEIGELDLRLQAKLLRVLQERRVTPVGSSKSRPVDIRVIAATNRNLQTMVKRGEFREDLFFRLSVVVVNLPPLRERREDILPLAEHFLRLQAEVYDEEPKVLSDQAGELLLRHSWPGNIRELANVIERAYVLSRTRTIHPTDLPPGMLKKKLLPLPLPPESCEESPEGAWPLDLDELKRRAITEALRRTNYCKMAAGRLMGINIQRLNRLIKRLGIPEAKPL